jgi:hypothetical protein
VTRLPPVSEWGDATAPAQRCRPPIAIWFPLQIDASPSWTSNVMLKSVRPPKSLIDRKRWMILKQSNSSSSFWTIFNHTLCP